MAESWSGPKTQALAEVDRLGYPVVVDGCTCGRKIEAMRQIERGSDIVVVERFDPAEHAPVSED